MVLGPIVNGVARGCGRRLSGGIIIQFVAIVTNADFKLHGLVIRVNHCGREEGTVQLVLASTEEGS